MDVMSRRFRLRPSAVLCGVLLAPMGAAYEIPPDSVATNSPFDSLTTNSPSDEGHDRITRFTFAGGSGTYGRTLHTSRTIFAGTDCYGDPYNQQINADFNFKDEFSDYGGEIDVQATDKFHVGVRGGWVNETVKYWGTNLDPALVDTLFQSVDLGDTSFTYYYINPCFAIEGETIGFGLGFVYSNNRLWTNETVDYGNHDDDTVYPTGHFRAGRLDKVYAKLSLFEGVPIYSGGGTWTAVVGGRLVKPVELLGGFSARGPYTQSSVLLRANVDLGRYWMIGVNHRWKSDVEDAFMPRFSESATSLSLSYKIYH